MTSNKKVWNVFYEDINAREISTFNVFNHGGFQKDLDKLTKKHLNKEEFSKELKCICQYYFWFKTEYEVVISEWPPACNRKPVEEKIDIFTQLQMNWDIFVDYCYKTSNINTTKSCEALAEQVDD